MPQVVINGTEKLVPEGLEDTPALARRTDTSESYWHKKRVDGTGPAYLKIGSLVRYKPSVVDAWLAEQTRKSTSDSGPTEDANPAAAALPEQRQKSSKTRLERARAKAEHATAMLAAMEEAVARRRGGGEAA